MRIAICHPSIPFMRGGAEILVEGLYEELINRHHAVELVKIPFQWYPPYKILDSVLSWKLIDLTESNGEKIDLIISTKFPSYVVNHPNHVTWLFHQHRPAYDLWNFSKNDLAIHTQGNYVRQKIIELDNNVLKKVKKLYTLSKTVSQRLIKYNKIESEPLYAPVKNAKKFHNKEYGDYILFPSRISPVKRQDLLVESLKYVKQDVKCKIIGFESHKKWLDEKIKGKKYADKIELVTNVSDDELIDLYSKALAVVFIPREEDYGFITLEAFLSRKPVLTASDSGGPLEFVTDAKNGFIVEPNPKKIAEGLDRFYEDSEKTKQMGVNGFKTYQELNLSWDHVIDKLIK